MDQVSNKLNQSLKLKTMLNMDILCQMILESTIKGSKSSIIIEIWLVRGRCGADILAHIASWLLTEPLNQLRNTIRNGKGKKMKKTKNLNPIRNSIKPNW